jgi:hypothetical protein
VGDVGTILGARSIAEIRTDHALLLDYSLATAASLADYFIRQGNRLDLFICGLFWQRCPNAFLSAQYRYLTRVGSMIALGIGMGLSALALHGHFEPPFGPFISPPRWGPLLPFWASSKALPKAWQACSRPTRATSDKTRKQNPLALLGYGSATIGKLFLYFSTSWEWVFTGRVVDRFGKGIRTAPRDALIAGALQANQLGHSFCLHRALDTLGAVIGITIASARLPLCIGRSS